MPTHKKFIGINNVLPPEHLRPNELSIASNVDIGNDGEATLRYGFSQASATAHRNVHQASGFVLATRGAGGDLVNVTSGATLLAGVGNTRMWYCDLPDGRTIYSNGVSSGVVTAAARTAWGVPLPTGIGAASNVAGSLFPGNYQYSITHKRTSDGLEGAPLYSGPVALTTGLSLTGLPTLAGHTTNVYLTSHYGNQGYFAGNTAGSTFTFTGQNRTLVKPCLTDFLDPAPACLMPTMFGGRVLIAVGNVLYASKHGQFELFDLHRDFKQFSGAIKMIAPVDDGVYIGTADELAFLAGSKFDELRYSQVVNAGVVLGSGVQVDGEHIQFGEGVGKGRAMICIADRGIVAGFNSGLISRMTEGRYVTDVTEVAATFRLVNRVPQYIAIAQ